MYASDIYSTFFAKDPMNPEAGRRYRSMVLEYGASRPEADILREYLGRDCNGDAYYAELAKAMEGHTGYLSFCARAPLREDSP